jgi:hypothetical protein
LLQPVRQIHGTTMSALALTVAERFGELMRITSACSVRPAQRLKYAGRPIRD